MKLWIGDKDMVEQYILRYEITSKYFNTKRVIYEKFYEYCELMDYVRENNIKDYTIYSKVIL